MPMRSNRFLTLLSYVLFPISFLWENIYRLRRFLYHYGFLSSKRFEVPIISIGNVTFGGTGKTPFTLWLSRYFNDADKKVMVLMRGYKGNLENSSGVLRSGRKLGFNPHEFGDEAILLARRLKNASIVVGKRRGDNLRYYFDQELPDIVLLDDGHQHIQIERRCNIVLFDALMPIDRYKVAPLGYLREGLSALQDADIVVLGRVDQVESEKINQLKNLCRKYLNPKVPFAEMKYSPTGLFNSSYEMKFGVDELHGKKAICIAGIASPQYFFNLVEGLGVDIVDQMSFPDHHYFTTEEVESLLDKASRNNAYLITTEKDIVKLRKIVSDERMLYLEIRVEFLSGEKEVKDIISRSIKAF